jgi:hypothetical protein
MRQEEDRRTFDDWVPQPVPSRYRGLDPSERRWRARACIVLWLSGLPARSAWLFALSTDPEWEALMRGGLTRANDDGLYVHLLRRHLSRLAGGAATTLAYID